MRGEGSVLKAAGSLGDTSEFHSPYLGEVYAPELAVGGVGHGVWLPRVTDLRCHRDGRAYEGEHGDRELRVYAFTKRFTLHAALRSLRRWPCLRIRTPPSLAC